MYHSQKLNETEDIGKAAEKIQRPQRLNRNSARDLTCPPLADEPGALFIAPQCLSGSSL